MIVVHPAKSYLLMETVFDKQNDGKPLAARLKGAHLETMKVLVRLLKKELGNYQVFGRKAGPDGHNLRSLRTNTVQLAKMLKCAERTVRNRLNRLASFSWIKKVFHGSNAAYEIYVNLDLLHLQETMAPHSNSVAGIFANPLPSMRQFLPDTLSRVPGQDTSIPKELSGLPSGTDAATTASATPAPSGNQQQPVTDVAGATPSAGYHPSSENPAGNPSASRTPSKKVPAKKVSPPAKLPKTMAQATAHLSDRDRARLPGLLNTVWDHALAELDEWLPGFLVANEIKRGKIGLAEFFAYSNPERWKDAATEFIERIDMVTGWCERRTAAGKKTFIRLPSYWFDHRNGDGFARTKTWYLEQQHHRKQMKIRSEINRCLKVYWRALESNGGDVDEALRIIKQRLEKRGGPALYKLFTDKVATQTSINLVA